MFQMTRLSATSRTTSSSGHLVAVICVDCQQCALAIIYMTIPVLGFFCLPFMFLMLADRVGRGPAICCAAWLGLAVLVPVPITRLQNYFWMTRLSATSRTTSSSGHLVAVICVDCQQCALAIIYMTIPVLGFFCLPFMFLMLADRVGRGPAICCAAWLGLAVLVPVPITRLQNYFWRKILMGRDQRLKRMVDLLTSVRLVKMCAWEDAYMDSVKRLRETEMTPVFRVNLLDGLIDSLYSGTSSMMIFILFWGLAVFDPTRRLNPTLSFSSIYMLSLTDMVTSNLSQLLRTRSLVMLAMRRIISFCSKEEAEENNTTSTDSLLRKGDV
ncbi:putative ABC transporter [Ixodes scapularis]